MSKTLQAGIQRTFMFMVLGVTLVLAACASKPTRDETQAQVDAAHSTLDNFVRDPGMTWFRERVGQARAILISPQIVQAGFIVGGSGGAALSIARNERGNGWNGVAFYRVASGTLGRQAGAQSSEMVALVMTEKGLNSLLSTSFKLGATSASPPDQSALAPQRDQSLLPDPGPGSVGRDQRQLTSPSDASMH